MAIKYCVHFHWMTYAWIGSEMTVVEAIKILVAEPFSDLCVLCTYDLYTIWLALLRLIQGMHGLGTT